MVRSQFLAVIFSKDRPLQLQACLQSLHSHVQPPPPARPGIMQVCVIAAVSDPGYRLAYDRVQQRYADVHFLYESDGAGFQVLFDSLFGSYPSDFVFFLVDDAVIYAPVDLLVIADVLSPGSHCFAYHARLHSGITYCYTRSAVCQQPPLLHHATHFEYLPILGSHDWSYCWDLSGSVYRRSDVDQIRARVGGAERSHPNLLELAGNRAIRDLGLFPSDLYQFNACPCQPTLSIVTVNRVQRQFKNAVYEESGGTVERLKELFDAGYEIDAEAYAARRYDRVHIGDLFVKAATDYDREESRG